MVRSSQDAAWLRAQLSLSQVRAHGARELLRGAGCCTSFGLRLGLHRGQAGSAEVEAGTKVLPGKTGRSSDGVSRCFTLFQVCPYSLLSECNKILLFCPKLETQWKPHVGHLTLRASQVATDHSDLPVVHSVLYCQRKAVPPRALHRVPPPKKKGKQFTENKHFELCAGRSDCCRPSS